MSRFAIDSKQDQDGVLPDSRAKILRGAVYHKTLGWMEPIFCANCGKEGGMVPEANMTFVFWQCDPCFKKYGEIAGTMVMPDQVFWDMVKEEQLEAHGRILADKELLAVAESNTSPLATLLLKKGR